jgi:predicted  nucleic acid-binding Zn-ribbon protein
LAYQKKKTNEARQQLESAATSSQLEEEIHTLTERLEDMKDEIENLRGNLEEKDEEIEGGFQDQADAEGELNSDTTQAP